MERIYKPLDDPTDDEISQIIERNLLDEIALLPLSVGQNHPNWKFAQDLCVKLSEHPEPLVRSNAILGLAYIARTKRKLEKHIVKPIVLKALREHDQFKWRIEDAIEDINLFMGWNIAKKSLDRK